MRFPERLLRNRRFLLCVIIAIGAIAAVAAEQKKEAAAQTMPAGAAASAPRAAAKPQSRQPAQEQEAGFRIDQPGTITFTVGVKIVGKVEKPEVVIFLPKEKPYYRKVGFSHSFKGDVLEPLPLEPQAGN